MVNDMGLWEQMGYSLGQECEDKWFGADLTMQLDHVQAFWSLWTLPGVLNSN